MRPTELDDMLGMATHAVGHVLAPQSLVEAEALHDTVHELGAALNVLHVDLIDQRPGLVRGCVDGPDLLGLCPTCGAVMQTLSEARAGWHNPDNGGCPFGRATVAVACVTRVCRWARLRARYHWRRAGAR